LGQNSELFNTKNVSDLNTNLSKISLVLPVTYDVFFDRGVQDHFSPGGMATTGGRCVLYVYVCMFLSTYVCNVMYVCVLYMLFALCALLWHPRTIDYMRPRAILSFLEKAFSLSLSLSLSLFKK
jgi:hypothetical protein